MLPKIQINRTKKSTNKGYGIQTFLFYALINRGV